MPEAQRSLYQYAVIRVVPDVERGECFNVGVVLLCRDRRFLAARCRLDERVLATLAPGLDPATLQGHLDTIEAIAAGDPTGGPIAQFSPGERFHWLVSPSSTMVQPGPVHTGLCGQPAEMLDHLFASLVERRAAGTTPGGSETDGPGI
ncbi:MAG: DUF3037 domain-containing protein [Dehalococcoidia bacterium]